MSSTTRIPKAEITGVYGYLLKRFSRKLLDDVPEPGEVMWHNRAVLTSAMGFGRKVEKWDQTSMETANVSCTDCVVVPPRQQKQRPLVARVAGRGRPVPGRVN